MQYKYLIIPFAVWFFIQLFKLIYDLVTTKKFNFKRILGAGGMPSSHSAVVTSLATMIGINQGFDSQMFALATIFAFVVMYDAAGIRRAAGKQAHHIKYDCKYTWTFWSRSYRKITRSIRTYTNTSYSWSNYWSYSWIDFCIKGENVEWKI